jgi:hypothetical protein
MIIGSFRITNNKHLEDDVLGVASISSVSSEALTHSTVTSTHTTTRALNILIVQTSLSHHGSGA